MSVQGQDAAEHRRRLLDAGEHVHADGEPHDHDHDAGALAEQPAAAGGAGGAHDEAPAGDADAGTPAAASGTVGAGTLAVSQYYGSYTIDDDTYGTMVEVEVTTDTREIMTNSIPPFETDFPVPANNFTIEAQNLTYSVPLEPVSPFRNSPVPARQFGISVLGILFEPGTAETAVCVDGSELNIEADTGGVDLGVDENGAHVRNTNGMYHYHNLPHQEIAIPDESQDIVHVGFSFDSHLVYYSRSGVYKSSYVLSTEPRAQAPCVYNAGHLNMNITLEETPDGSVAQDWVWTAGGRPFFYKHVLQWPGSPVHRSHLCSRMPKVFV